VKLHHLGAIILYERLEMFNRSVFEDGGGYDVRGKGDAFVMELFMCRGVTIVVSVPHPVHL